MSEAEDILAIDDLTYDTVPCPEWGRDVRVRSLTGTEGEEWAASLTIRRPKKGGGWEDIPNNVGSKARLLVKAIVNDAGDRMFTDQQANALGAKNSGVIGRLFEKVCDLSGLSDDAAEVIEGESEGETEGTSPSSSPENSATPTPTSSSDD